MKVTRLLKHSVWTICMFYCIFYDVYSPFKNNHIFIQFLVVLSYEIYS